MAPSTPPPLAVVTGGSSGIGRAIALRLAEWGYELLLVDLDASGMEETARRCEQLGATARSFLGDVADARCWDRLVDSLGAQREVALLVNAAGVLLVGDFTECSADDIRRIVEVNLLGAMLGCRAVAPRLAPHSHARLPSGVLNVASVFALLRPPRFAVYNASKAGLVAFSETLRHELASRGHTVTVVLPGVVKTSLFERARYVGQEPSEEQALKKAIQDYAERAELTPERVATAALAAFGRRRATATVGRRARLYALLARLVPSLLRRLVVRQAANQIG